jgi:hypothetical protein
MNCELTVPELLAQPETLLGHRVVLDAILVLRGGECYLVSNLDAHESRERIEVFAPGLERELNASVAGWIGGPAIYFDKVKISGVLRAGTTRRSPYSISDLGMLVLYRDEEVYKIV